MACVLVLHRDWLLVQQRRSCPHCTSQAAEFSCVDKVVDCCCHSQVASADAVAAVIHASCINKASMRRAHAQATANRVTQPARAQTCAGQLDDWLPPFDFKPGRYPTPPCCCNLAFAASLRAAGRAPQHHQAAGHPNAQHSKVHRLLLPSIVAQ